MTRGVCPRGDFHHEGDSWTNRVKRADCLLGFMRDQRRSALDICHNYSGPRSRVELALKRVEEEEEASTERAGKKA